MCSAPNRVPRQDLYPPFRLSPGGHLLVEGLDLLNLIVAAKEDSCLVMDILWHNVQHPPHLAVDSLTTR